MINDAPAAPSRPDVQRCSLWSREVGLRPAGTAGTPTGFLLVDWPLPWPVDIGQIDGLVDVLPMVAARGLRMQATVPIEGRPARVAVYDREGVKGGDGFRGFAGREIDAEPGREGVTAAARALLEGGEGTPVPAGEVLICTHGRRDSCCGSFGTTLVMELTGAGAIKAGRTGGLGAGLLDRPIRRTSHTGGHRFAPTAIVLPEGSLWAFTDRDLLRRLTTRQGPIDDVAPRYRGCAGLESAQLQAIEAAVLAEIGWPLFEARRAGEHLEGDRYRLYVTEAGAAEGQVWEASVVTGRRLSQPACGAPSEAETEAGTVAGPATGKPTTEWEVQDLKRVSPAC